MSQEVAEAQPSTSLAVPNVPWLTFPDELRRVVLEFYFQGTKVSYHHNRTHLGEHGRSEPFSVLQVSKSFVAKGDVVAALLSDAHIVIEENADFQTLAAHLSSTERARIRSFHVNTYHKGSPSYTTFSTQLSAIGDCFHSLSLITLGAMGLGLTALIGLSVNSDLSLLVVGLRRRQQSYSMPEALTIPVTGRTRFPFATTTSDIDLVRSRFDLDTEYNHGFTNKPAMEAVIQEGLRRYCRNGRRFEPNNILWQVTCIIDAIAYNMHVDVQVPLDLVLYGDVVKYHEVEMATFSTSTKSLMFELDGLRVEVPQVIEQWFLDQYKSKL